MRYRIKNYEVSVATDELYISFRPPQDIFDALTTTSGSSSLDAKSKRRVLESIRLIANETRGGYIMCSTGSKTYTAANIFDIVYDVIKYPVLGVIALTFFKSVLIIAADGDEDDIVAINAIQNSDQFTIEVDWGESPEQLTGNLVQATTAEYEAFKSRMETEIANILTPITEE